MELDDLKQAWKDTNNSKLKNTDIMELIRHKSYGPIAALKREYRKQMIVMLMLPVFLFITNMDDLSKPLHSILFWSYVIFCIGVVAFAYYNYRIAARMESMEAMVKSHLVQQINTLQESLRWKVIGLRIALLFFIALTEVVPYFQHYRMLDKWHSLHPLIRFGSYAAFLTLQFFLSKKILQRKFGRHLSYLKELVKEME
jgi:uncharacterized membrane protein